MVSPTVLLFMEKKNIMDHLQFSPKLKFRRPYIRKSMKRAWWHPSKKCYWWWNYHHIFLKMQKFEKTKNDWSNSKKKSSNPFTSSEYFEISTFLQNNYVTYMRLAFVCIAEELGRPCTDRYCFTLSYQWMPVERHVALEFQGLQISRLTQLYLKTHSGSNLLRYFTYIYWY